MDILYSKKTKAMAAAYSLSPQEMAFADLVTAGWDIEDAYYQAFQTGFSWTKAAVTRKSREILAKIGVKQRVKELRKGKINEEAKEANRDSDEETEDVVKALSKENMLKDLYMARKKMTVGSKDWLDTNKMIADITRMKQEEVKKEDNNVHFFVPLTCEHCGLYIERKKK